MTAAPEPLDAIDERIAVRVDCAEWRALGDADALARRATDAALEAAAIPAGRAEVSVLLADDDAIAALNRQFRGLDQPTNVLSWPSVEFSAPARPADLAPAPFFLGDLALAFETTQAEALSVGKHLEQHAAHLIIHGVLHLLGYRHDTEDDAASMEAQEIAALASLGMPSPYGAV